MESCAGCCDKPICGVIECRSRTGHAVICGHIEIVSASTPPKKYLTCTFTGSLHGDVYDQTDHPGQCQADHQTGYFDVVTSGEAVYDPATCTLSSYGNNAISENGGTPTNYQLTGPPYGSADTCNQTVNATQTQITRTGTPTCCTSSWPLAQIHTGTRQATLTNEDTIFDAIERASKSAWGSFGDCADNSAYIEARGASTYDSDFREAEVQTCCTNLEIGNQYRLCLGTVKRVTGSGGAFISGPTAETTVEATATEECFVVDVPMVDGYEVKAVSLAVLAIEEDCPT